MTPLEILKEARARVEKGWTQHAFGRDAEGRELGAHGLDQAECVCTIGAIFATGRNYTDEVMWAARRYLRKQLGITDINLAQWNDQPSRTKEQVLALFDKAIQSLQ